MADEKTKNICVGCAVNEPHEHRCIREIPQDDVLVRVIEVTGHESIKGRGTIFEGMLSELNPDLLSIRCDCPCNDALDWHDMIR